jgi:hypothetical protein
MRRKKYNFKENDSFGFLKFKRYVRKVYENGKARTYCECECVCGKIVTRRSDYLIGHIHRIQSCGCEHPSTVNLGNKSNHWGGWGEISGEYIAHVKAHAKIRNIEYNLDGDYLWDLFLAQDRKCKLSGIPLVFRLTRKKHRSNIVQTASLDRIDSNKPYIEENVQWIHKDVNLMKNHFSEDRFKEICKLVVENLNLQSSPNNSSK